MLGLDSTRLDMLDTFFAEAEKVGIIVHTHPDGDAMGSSAALCEYLCRETAADVMIVTPDRCPATLAFVYSDDDIIVASDRPSAAAEHIGSSDLILCLDMNGFDRAAQLGPLLAAADCRKVLVDHHLGPQSSEFDLVFSTAEISSTCELLYWILDALCTRHGRKLPYRCAYALMTGMTTDTNNFANSVFPTTFEMASRLLAEGVDRDDILTHLYNEFRENRFRAMGRFLTEKMKILPGGIAYVVFRESDWKELDLEDGETEGFVNLPLGIRSVCMSIFLKEEKGVFRVSVRSKKGWSANRLATEYFNGGGHEQAAGGRLRIPGDIGGPGDVVEYVERAAARFLQEQNA